MPPPSTFWRIPGHKQLLHDGKAGADRAQPRLRLRLRAGARPGRRHGRRLCPSRRCCRACARPCARCGAPCAGPGLRSRPAGTAHLAGARRDPAGVLARRGRRLFGADAAADWYSDGGLRSRCAAWCGAAMR
jgi:hypothetical protein